MENKYTMPASDNILYAKRNIIDSIYSEAKIEGIGVTYPDTKEIFEGRTVAGMSIDETLAVNNLKHAWQFILENIDYPLDLRFIRQVNSEVGNRIVLNAGLIRQQEVEIGGTAWKPSIPNEVVVKSTIEYILSSDNSATDKALDLMLYIMRAQLFMDGNKRTAQIVANKVLISGGAGIVRIPPQKIAEFMKLLVNFYENEDSIAIKQFLYDNAISGAIPDSTPKDLSIDYNKLYSEGEIEFSSELDRLAGAIIKGNDSFTMELTQYPFVLTLIVTTNTSLQFDLNLKCSDNTLEHVISGTSEKLVTSLLPLATNTLLDKLSDIIIELRRRLINEF